MWHAHVEFVIRIYFAMRSHFSAKLISNLLQFPNNQQKHLLPQKSMLNESIWGVVCLFVFKFIYLFILLIPHLLCFCFQERDYLPESSYSLPPNEYYDNPLYSHPTKVGHSALGVYPDYLPKTPSTLYPYGYRAKEGSLDRLHETASSRSRSRKTARIVWTLVAVVFVTAIVAGTAVIIYLTSQCKFTSYSKHLCERGYSTN